MTKDVFKKSIQKGWDLAPLGIKEEFGRDYFETWMEGYFVPHFIKRHMFLINNVYLKSKSKTQGVEMFTCKD